MSIYVYICSTYKYMVTAFGCTAVLIFELNMH